MVQEKEKPERGAKTSNKIDKKTFNDLYRKSKGGFFRSKGHIIVYLEEKGILKGTK